MIQDVRLIAGMMVIVTFMVVLMCYFVAGIWDILREIAKKGRSQKREQD